MDDVVRQDGLRISRAIFLSQFEILFVTTLAMSVTCLAISSASQIAGARLAAGHLPRRPAIAALRRGAGAARNRQHVLPSLHRRLLGLERLPEDASPKTALYDIVRQSTDTYIADFNLCLLVLCIHIVAGGMIAWIYVTRMKRSDQG